MQRRSAFKKNVGFAHHQSMPPVTANTYAEMRQIIKQQAEQKKARLEEAVRAVQRCAIGMAAQYMQAQQAANPRATFNAEQRKKIVESYLLACSSQIFDANMKQMYLKNRLQRKKAAQPGSPAVRRSARRPKAPNRYRNNTLAMKRTLRKPGDGKSNALWQALLRAAEVHSSTNRAR
jgi:hypothetical protein